MFCRTAVLSLASPALFLACAGAVSAQSQPPPTGPLSGDSRLDRKVTVQVEGMSLSELLTRLSAATGVSIYPDRETADDKVAVFGPPRPLRELMLDLAELHGHRWQRRAAGSGADYLLVRDPKARGRETAWAEAQEREALRRLEAQVRALRESRFELERRPTDDPIRAALLDPKLRQATEYYALLNARQRELLVERGRYRILFPALPAPFQEPLLQHLREEQSRPAEVQFGSRKALVYRRRHPPDVDLTLRLFSDGRAAAWMYPGGARFALHQIPLRRPPLRGNPYTGAAAALNPPLPHIPESLLQSETGSLERLRRLSETTGVPVVADYFRLPVSVRGLGDRKAGSDAGAPLDALALKIGALWWRRGDTLLFRTGDWFERRRYEIPDRWLDETARRLAQRPEPTLGDLLRLDELTFRQLIGLQCLPSTGVGLGGSMDYQQRAQAAVPELIEILKGFGQHAEAVIPDLERLPEEERKRSRGLLFQAAQLSPRQRALLLPLLAVQKNGPDGILPETFEVSLRCRAPEKAKRRPGYRTVAVELYFGVKGAGQDSTVLLPQNVPDDRREQAVIRAD